ncbi:MAG: hypothetical protein ACUVTL_09620 [Thermoproteota archaeon]
MLDRLRLDIMDFLQLLNFVMGVLIVIILAVGAFEIVTRRRKQE